MVGARAVYERNPDYVPRASGSTGCTAGPKVTHFERVEWIVIPDEETAASALQTGEVDWWEWAQDSPHFHTAPKVSANIVCSTSIALNRSISGVRRCSGIMGMSS